MPLGQSFAPGPSNEDPRLKKRRTPVQQALQSVQLQMPAARGDQNALTSRLLAGQSGAGAATAAQPGVPGSGAPGLQTMLNALTGSGTSSTSGFAGGGFGAGGPVASAGGASTRPSKPVGGGVGKPPTGPGKPPGGIGVPGLGKLPGKVQGAVGAIKDKLPPGGFKLPSGLKPPKKPAFEAPEPGDKNWVPPINPNIPGGGMLDHMVSAPPVVFGGGGPSFTTPTGGAGGGFGGAPAPAPAPVPRPIAPASQGSGGVYTPPGGYQNYYGGPPPGYRPY